MAATSRSDAEEWRRVRPNIPAPTLAALPAVQSFELSNGLSVHVVENHRLPLVATTVVVHGGSSNRARGVAKLVASSISRGWTKMPPSEFADALAALGGTITNAVQPDYTTITIEALAERWAATMQLVGDAITHPDLGSGRVAALRSELSSQVQARAQIDSALALDLVQHDLYGDDPYGWTPLSAPHAYEQVTSRDAQEFYEAFWQPRNSTIVVAGDVTVAQTRAALEKTFGTWQGSTSQPRPVARPLPPAPASRIFVVNRPSAKQATIVAAARVAARGSKDWDATFIANRVLGGSFDSRLNVNLRQVKAYSYAIRSVVLPMSRDSVLYANSSVRLDRAGASLKEIFAELEGMRSRPADGIELETAKLACRLGGRLEIETNGEIVATLAAIVGVNLPVSELAARFSRLELVQPGEVAAQLPAAHTSAVLVGPAATLLEQLRDLGFTATEIALPQAH